MSRFLVSDLKLEHKIKYGRVIQLSLYHNEEKRLIKRMTNPIKKFGIIFYYFIENNSLTLLFIWKTVVGESESYDASHVVQHEKKNIKQEMTC